MTSATASFDPRTRYAALVERVQRQEAGAVDELKQKLQTELADGIRESRFGELAPIQKALDELDAFAKTGAAPSWLKKNNAVSEDAGAAQLAAQGPRTVGGGAGAALAFMAAQKTFEKKPEAPVAERPVSPALPLPTPMFVGAQKALMDQLQASQPLPGPVKEDMTWLWNPIAPTRDVHGTLDPKTAKAYRDPSGGTYIVAQAKLYLPQMRSAETPVIVRVKGGIDLPPGLRVNNALNLLCVGDAAGFTKLRDEYNAAAGPDDKRRVLSRLEYAVARDLATPDGEAVLRAFGFAVPGNTDRFAGYAKDLREAIASDGLTLKNDVIDAWLQSSEVQSALQALDARGGRFEMNADRYMTMTIATVVDELRAVAKQLGVTSSPDAASLAVAATTGPIGRPPVGGPVLATHIADLARATDCPDVLRDVFRRPLAQNTLVEGDTAGAAFACFTSHRVGVSRVGLMTTEGKACGTWVNTDGSRSHDDNLADTAVVYPLRGAAAGPLDATTLEGMLRVIGADAADVAGIAARLAAIAGTTSCQSVVSVNNGKGYALIAADGEALPSMATSWSQGPLPPGARFDHAILRAA